MAVRRSPMLCALNSAKSMNLTIKGPVYQLLKRFCSQDSQQSNCFAATVKNADLMFKQSVWTSLISASLSSKHLKEGGVLVLTGAQPSLGGTPGMLGYGMAKAAVHQLVKGLGMKGSGLPTDTSALAILPMTLDTPMNRKGMPNADHSQWTPLEFVANLLFQWAKEVDRPGTGSLVKIITKDGSSSHEVHTGALL